MESGRGTGNMFIKLTTFRNAIRRGGCLFNYVYGTVSVRAVNRNTKRTDCCYSDQYYTTSYVRIRHGFADLGNTKCYR